MKNYNTEGLILGRFTVRFRWIARSGGGLFVGARIDFPSYLLFTDSAKQSTNIYPVLTIKLGFLLFVIEVDIFGSECSNKACF